MEKYVRSQEGEQQKVREIIGSTASTARVSGW